jgi:Ca2+/Na+ antiporter
VTVFENLYSLFGSVGAVFEIGAILTVFILAFLVRGRGQTFYWTLSSSVILLAAFVVWIIFVADANAELARWLTNPVPPDWTRTRNQWEYTHAVNGFIKIAGLSLLVISVLVETKETKKV